MKKTAVIATFAVAMLPFTACSSNNEQAAYMQSSNAEQNAREAEQAEEEFAQLASKEEAPKAEKKSHKTEKTEKKTVAKADKTAKKSVAKTEKKHELNAKASDELAAIETREPASVHQTKSHASAGSQTYTVQLGAFKVKENASKLAAKLKTEGFPVIMADKENSHGLFVVHLEPTPNKTEAQKWQTDLKLKAFDSTLTSKHD